MRRPFLHRFGRSHFYSRQTHLTSPAAEQVDGQGFHELKLSSGGILPVL
jgi:hypothetical protein